MGKKRIDGDYRARSSGATKTVRPRTSRADLNASERRLDSLARVLQGSSECVAVTFVNGSFIIAANELAKGSKDAKGTRIEGLIQNVISQNLKRSLTK